MAFVVITRPSFGRRVCSPKPGWKSNYDTLDLAVGVEHHSKLLNTLGMGMELHVAEKHAKMNWNGSKTLY